jgi:hypothetical protein
LNPELRTLVVEASMALARLDADRLEELALSCQALNRDLAPVGDERRAELARQAQGAVGDMAVFGRVLEATRANLSVLSRLRELREGRLEYGGRPAPRLAARGRWALTGNCHGDD